VGTTRTRRNSLGPFFAGNVAGVVVRGTRSTILRREGWGTPPMISRCVREALEDPEVTVLNWDDNRCVKLEARLSVSDLEMSCWLNSADSKSL